MKLRFKLFAKDIGFAITVLSRIQCYPWISFPRNGNLGILATEVACKRICCTKICPIGALLCTSDTRLVIVSLISYFFLSSFLQLKLWLFSILPIDPLTELFQSLWLLGLHPFVLSLDSTHIVGPQVPLHTLSIFF